jgi:hypothetical protein
MSCSFEVNVELIGVGDGVLFASIKELLPPAPTNKQEQKGSKEMHTKHNTTHEAQKIPNVFK